MKNSHFSLRKNNIVSVYSKDLLKQKHFDNIYTFLQLTVIFVLTYSQLLRKFTSQNVLKILQLLDTSNSTELIISIGGNRRALY